MARATGGSSKVTYPRKPHVFPFYSAGWPLSRNLYLPTYVELHDGVPPPTRELELLDPRAQTNRRCVDRARAVRHGRYSCECKRVYLSHVGCSLAMLQ